MATELDRDEYGVIRHDREQGILELEWLESSATMTDDDFKRSMQRYAGLAAEHSTPYLLVDVTKFRHSMGEGVAAWRDAHIIPAYNRAGVKKFAFLLPAGASGTVEEGKAPAEEPPGTFPTGYFTERRSVLEWFAERRS
ncbi:MAG: hypothetical protein ACRDMU_08805 [Gaiellaceae bacterium]